MKIPPLDNRDFESFEESFTNVLTIGLAEYTLRFGTNLVNRNHMTCLGLYMSDSGTIYIDCTYQPALVIRVIWHEIMHVLLDQYRLDKLLTPKIQEALCDAAGFFISSVLNSTKLASYEEQYLIFTGGKDGKRKMPKV